MLLTLDAFEDTQQLTPDNITAWEGRFRMAYHMNREYGKGIAGATHVGRAMSGTLNSVERLARILYNHYDRNGDSENAVILNNLVTAWKDIRSEMANPNNSTFLVNRREKMEGWKGEE